MVLARQQVHSGGFTAIFEGNGHTINNLYSRNTKVPGNNVGLFRLVEASAVIRNVGVTNAGVYGKGGDDNVAPLVGRNDGTIIASHATGNADGGDGGDNVGGLVGLGDGGTITASYANASADGGDGDDDHVGGLVGQNDGTITASYATGNANGGDGIGDEVGGLVGWNKSGTIIAGYATGNADGGDGKEDRVGGLAGESEGTITASYAIGNVNGGTGNSDQVDGLVGYNNSGTITDSYAFGSATGESVGDNGNSRPPGVTTSYGLTAGNVGTSWNNASGGTDDAWSFIANMNPALVYADYDGTWGTCP